MDEARAIEVVSALVGDIDLWADIEYQQRRSRSPDLGLLAELRDKVVENAYIAREIARSLGEHEIAERLREGDSSTKAGSWQVARAAAVELRTLLGRREEIAEIIGALGPSLPSASLHHTVWESAAPLWHDGHPRQAVQTAGTALEGLLQRFTGPSVSGENLAVLFSTTGPVPGSPRLRVRDIAPEAKTWRSIHDGAAALVRGAMMAIRNLMSHPGWPDPDENEALEMIAVLSYVARLVDRCDLVSADE